MSRYTFQSCSYWLVQCINKITIATIKSIYNNHTIGVASFPSGGVPKLELKIVIWTYTRTIRHAQPLKKKKKSVPQTGVLKYDWISTIRYCYISARVLICFRLNKGRATFFRHETIVASFLYLMVLFFKVIVNHTSKYKFLMLLNRIIMSVFYAFIHV